MLRHGLLPFSDLDPGQFESFVLAFLGAGIGLEVIEPGKIPGESPRAVRYRLIGSSLYGGSGPGGQRGIDIIVTTETGAKWVFQCKHYNSGFTPAKARAAVAKAAKDFPSAGRYFLVLSREPTPAVRDAVEQNKLWEIWGGSELSIRFLNEVEHRKQIEILRRCFPEKAEEIIKRLFPSHDDFLVSVEQYFEKWRQTNRIFNHRAQLVGRKDTLRRLNKFVDDRQAQALILPAAGGVGKTRLLLSFGEGFSEQHPGKQICFVDDAARPDTGSDALRVARDSDLVVVQDDAHRMESLRGDMVASLVEKNGKIILSTRPHAVDALVDWLSRMGVDANRICIVPSLKALSRQERVELAGQCLPKAHQDWAEPLAELAKECTLIITAGAALMSEGGLTPQTYHDSDEFRNAVFDRLENESFVNSVLENQIPLAKKILRLLAVLAPWSDNLLSLGDIGELLDCKPREFQEIFACLRAAGLLLETRDGWRVIPDLFADDLVYRGCYNDDGRLTDFARSLQDKLVPLAYGSVLGNLAEAEWQAQLRDKGRRSVESVLEPFWKRVCAQFEASNFLLRSEILKQWRRFSALQPERSMDLARLAIDLKNAPAPPEDYAISELGKTLFTHKEVLAQVPALIEPVAIFHSAFRLAVLDRLWETHQHLSDSNGTAADGALAAIGNVAKFRVNHTIDAPKAVLSWLDAKLKVPSAEAFCDRPSPILSVILKPIFEREIEDTFRDGQSFTIRTHNLSIENTQGLRIEALRILKDRVIPRGEIATLNALGVLGVAIEGVRLRVPDGAASGIVASWLLERQKALAVVEGLLDGEQSPRVLYRIRDVLTHHSQWDRQVEFKGQCAKLLRRIPDSDGMRLTRVLLSNAWHEFSEHSVHKGEDISVSDDRVVKEWQALADSVAVRFLEEPRSPEDLIAALDAVVADYRRAGMQPQCFELLSAIARLNPNLANSCIDTLLTTEKAEIDPWWTALFFAHHHFPDERLLGWTKKVFRDDNQARWRPLLSIFGWQGMGAIPKAILTEIGEWVHCLRDDGVDNILGELQWSNERKAPINEAILLNLNLPELSEISLAKLAGVLSQTIDLKINLLPDTFVTAFIHELARVGRLDEHGERPFVARLARLQPLKFLEMLIHRIEVAKERRGRGGEFIPMPLTSSLVMETLPEIEGYAEHASKIFLGLRSSDEEGSYWWRLLFQTAVLRVSPLGLDFLRQWIPEIETIDELRNLIQTMSFEGSMLIFSQPELARSVLAKAREVAPEDFDKLRWQLGFTASPKMRSYAGHELEPQYRYYREEAAKAAIIHQQDAELASMYREIVRAEDADAARHRRQAELDSVEW